MFPQPILKGQVLYRFQAISAFRVCVCVCVAHRLDLLFVPPLTSIVVPRVAILSQLPTPAGNAEHHCHMELSLRTCGLIAQHAESKADLCTLCRVNKRFQRAAERVLYSTIYASDAWNTFGMCSLFARTPRLALIVESLTLLVSDVDDGGPQSEVCLPTEFWPTVSNALRQMTGLHTLNLHLDNGGDIAQAWILSGTAFRLHSFHCDLQWDTHLVSFLNTQADIDDLYIIDYSIPDDTAQTSTLISLSLDPGALPNLSTLECTFTEAACALVPARPISRLKTCFSKTRLPEKKEELSLLFSKLKETTRPLRSLDIADSSYSDSFCTELLESVVNLQHQVHDLRYFGTFVLPIDGYIRLKFYGLLRRLHFLECVEVDVSEWEPTPPIPTGVCALASELRIYCPSLRRVIFVNDFERTVITVTRGTYVLDYDCNAEEIWREL